MNIHEYQAKKLLASRGVRIPLGKVARSAQEAERAAEKLGGSRWVLKAQIHAGGRGEGRFRDRPGDPGGVRVIESFGEIRAQAEQMLGQALITTQTGPGGTEVRQIYIEEACDVQREIYVGLLVDRGSGQPTFIASDAGGVDIESVARRSPESICRLAVDPIAGLDDQAARDLVSRLSLERVQADEAVRVMHAMYALFVDLDASLVEINPLGVLSDGQLVALDATVTFDDNALFRHPEVRDLRDEDELRVGELRAVHHGLNYVKLDGNIGCLASGAGLAMATVDAIRLLDGNPANFLDVPPAASAERVQDAVRLLISDPDVKSILVNVFGGGIMRCDTIADGIILANRESPLKVPMVVRLAGTSAEYAIRRLRDSGPAIVFARNMADAARKAVDAAREIKLESRRSWWDRMQETFVKRES